MYFRFGSALLLVLAISLAGVAFEKRNLALRRRLTRQHYQTAVLREKHAKLRLETQRLGAPNRVLNVVGPKQVSARKPADQASPLPRRTAPLLRWQRELSDTAGRQW